MAVTSMSYAVLRCELPIAQRRDMGQAAAKAKMVWSRSRG